MLIESQEKWPWIRGRNDLLITTNYAFGDDPIVDRLHYVGENDKLGWYGDFFDDVIVTMRDLQNRRLRLNLKLYDVDGLSDEAKQSINALATTAAVTFPQLSPLSGHIDLATKTLTNTIDHFDKHDEIIDQTITLEMEEPNTGHRLLQPGYFVCTREDIDGRDLSLNHDLRLVEGVDENTQEYQDASYAVLQIDKKFEERKKREIDQKVAKLIAQLQGKGRSEETDLHYLRETLDGYTRFQQLNRIQELESQSIRTPAEQTLLKELRAEETLQPYLSPL